MLMKTSLCSNIMIMTKMGKFSINTFTNTTWILSQSQKIKFLQMITWKEKESSTSIMIKINKMF